MLAATYKTKKELRASVGESLHFVETSAFGPEYTDNGTFSVVGPSPTQRIWFARVTMENGVISKVS